MLHHPRIAARIAEIEAETARAHSRNSDVLVGKLENVYRRAVVDHQFQAAARAVDLQARIRGFSGQIPVDAESDGWPDMPHLNAGRGSRPTASGDIRRVRRNGSDPSDF